MLSWHRPGIPSGEVAEKQLPDSCGETASSASVASSPEKRALAVHDYGTATRAHLCPGSHVTQARPPWSLCQGHLGPAPLFPAKTNICDINMRRVDIKRAASCMSSCSDSRPSIMPTQKWSGLSQWKPVALRNQQTDPRGSPWNDMLTRQKPGASHWPLPIAVSSEASLVPIKVGHRLKAKTGW